MRDRDFLVLLVVASLAIKIPIALFFLQGFGVDESLYLATARDYAETGIFGLKGEVNYFGFIAPLLAFVMSGFYKVFGELGSLMVSPIAGSLAIIAFFYLGKLAINQTAGRLSALFLFFNPAYFLLNTRPLTESVALLLFSTAVLVFLLAIENRRYRYFVLPMLLLTFLARYPYGILLAAFFVAIIALQRKMKFLLNQNVLAGIAIALVIAAPWFLYNYEVYGDVLGGSLRQGLSDVGFDYQRASWYVPYLFMIAGATFPFMLYGLLNNIREWRHNHFLIGFFVVFLIQFFGLGESVEERYILPILPFASILAVSGYMQMLKWKKNLAKYALIGMMVVNIIAAAYLTLVFAELPKYSETKEALEWSKENCGEVIYGNVFTQTYQITHRGVERNTLLTHEQEKNYILEKNVSCVVVSIYERPSYDFFNNTIPSEKKTFGNVFVYKIS